MALKMGKARALILTVLYIAAFAQLGVLTREYLDKLFQDGCEKNWGLCLTSEGKLQRSLGSYYTDLPSNILGSFIMGVVGTSAIVGLSDKKAIAILPASSMIQDNAPLLAGIRTGFCGSLTTFSAWQLQNVLLLVGGRGRDGGQWAQALWSVVIGMMTALAALVSGHHVAIAVAHLCSDRSVPRHGESIKKSSLAAEHAKISRSSCRNNNDTHQPDQHAKEEALSNGFVCHQQRGAPAAVVDLRQIKMQQLNYASRDLPQSGVYIGSQRTETKQRARARQQQNGRLEHSTPGRHHDVEAQLGISEPESHSANGNAGEEMLRANQLKAKHTTTPHLINQPTPGQRPAREHAARTHDASEGDGDETAQRRHKEEEEEDELGSQELGSIGAEDAEQQLEQKEEGDGVVAVETRKQQKSRAKVHLVFAVLCAALIASFITAAVIDNSSSHTGRRIIWLAVLLGIPGAILRWLLADLNFALPGRVSWLPAGTLAANTLSVIVIVSAQIPMDRSNEGKWSVIWLSAVQGGFCGALSTVSTLVNEIYQMFKEGAVGQRRAYAYMFITFATAIILGIVIYGTAHWT